MTNIPSQKLNNWEIMINPNNDIRLYENEELWMCNHNVDISEHQEIANKCEGKILIGGLGLGVILKQLQKKDDIIKVIVIDNSPEVIKMVWKYLELDNRFKIIQDNIKHYIKTTTKTFDYIYIDTFLDMNKKIYKKKVLPLKKLAEKMAPKDNIFFWRENKFKD